MTVTTWNVAGMTCQHCANAITEEVSELAGVSQVTVDRQAGTMVISSTADVPADAVTAAVTEAGNYTATPVEEASRS